MEFLKINIDSTRPFYTDSLGNIYNCQYKKMKCSQINGSHFLTFILNGDSKKMCKESIARLVYSTHNPKEDLSRYNIFKKDSTIKYPYQIDNLEKLKKNEMPIHNKLPAIQADKITPIKRKFYEKLSQADLNSLILLCRNKKVKSIEISKTLGLSKNTILKHRNDIKKLKIKNYKICNV